MGILDDFETWTKKGTSINDLLKKVEAKSPYLVGKEGLLPDWKIKGTPIGEVFSAEGYKAGGEWWRKAITTRGAAFGKGLLGIPDKAPGAEPTLPFGIEYPAVWDWVPPTAEDLSGMVKGAIPEIAIPPFPEIPKIEIPTIDLSPFAAGLAAMGAGIGGGLGGIPQMPQVPSLIDEDGEPNLVLIAAIAAVGLGGVYLISKR